MSRLTRITFLILALAPWAAAPPPAPAPRPAGLRTESQAEPVGLDAFQPRFAWRLEGERRGLRQTAYQVIVSTSPAALAAGRGELWDSGKVESDQDRLVPYGGAPLRSNQRYSWQVRVWDEAGRPSAWSAPASWVSGLLSPLSEWTAPWIGLDAAPPTLPQGPDPFGLGAAEWITHPSAAQPPEPTLFSFRKEITIDLATTRRALLAIHGDNPVTSMGELYLNGVELLQFGWGAPKVVDLTGWLRAGRNVLTVRDAPRLIAALRLEDAAGSATLIRSGGDWQACREAPDHWDPKAVEGADWGPVKSVCVNGQLPMRGKVSADASLSPPVARLRHEFTLRKPVRQALLHATALGLYEARLNGRRVGQGRFTPGWLQFDRRICLVTDDVTSHLRPGANALAAELADGWFSGHICWYGRTPSLRPRFAAQLHIEYADGSREVIATGPDWKAAYGPTLQADILMGERHDARAETPGWDQPGFDDRAWRAVSVGSAVTSDGGARFVDVTAKLAEQVKNNALSAVVDNALGGDPAPGEAKRLRVEYVMAGNGRVVTVEEGGVLRLPSPGDQAGAPLRIVRALYGRFSAEAKPPCAITARVTPPVEVFEELRPVAITQPHPGVYVFDFGRNLAGWTRLAVRGRAGRRVLIRHAEALRPDGSIDPNNLRSASAADEYILRGGGELDSSIEVWAPRFTYHGFRYAQVTGLEEPPTTATLTAVAAGSAGPLTSAFRCSSPAINRLYESICNTQRANMFEVPTCTPARDERLGYAGDLVAFLRTAQYNQRGLEDFGWKHLLDILDRQVEDGSKQQGNVGVIAPAPYGIGAAGPAPLDAGILTVLLPWSQFEFYGDLERARQAYPALRRYMSFVEQVTGDLNDGWLERDGGLGDQSVGDWMAPPGPPETPRAVLIRASATLAADRMAELAAACGRPEDAAHYRELAKGLRAAFARAHLKPGGVIDGDSLTAYALALSLDLVDAKARGAVARRFLQRLGESGLRPWVGYAGVGRLLPALSAAGRPDLAVRLLERRGFPSWGDMVAGSTTIWESWRTDGVAALSRPALGGCGEWLFASLLGIEPAAPGFRKTRVRPAIGCGLRFAEGAFESAQGRIAVAWRVAGERATLEVTIPPNTAGEVWLPAREAKHVRESGRPLAEAPQVKVAGQREGRVVAEVGAGVYRFEWPAGELTR